MIVGVTGGIGSGKSLVVSLLRRMTNAKVILTDDVARELMEKDNISYKKVVEKFGEHILDNNKNIDRKKLAEIVFNDKDKLLMLNNLTHQDVLFYIENEIKKVQSQEDKFIVIESALFKEAGFDRLCDEIWYINANEDVRRQRLKDNRGYTDSKITSIFHNQYRDKEYMEVANIVIDNSGDVDMLQNCIQKEINRLKYILEIQI